MVKKADLVELKLKEGDFSITIKNKAGEVPTVITTAAAPTNVVGTSTVAPSSEKKNDGGAKTTATPTTNDNLITFKSPMVGTFYRKPGVDKDPYVKVGDVVNGGDVLCIIEAMKLFNEIEFDGGSGKIVKILVDDSSPVEYDQPLFLIEKS